MTLHFGAPSSPMCQPRNCILGSTLAAGIAVSFSYVLHAYCCINNMSKRNTPLQIRMHIDVLCQTAIMLNKIPLKTKPSLTFLFHILYSAPWFGWLEQLRSRRVRALVGACGPGTCHSDRSYGLFRGAPPTGWSRGPHLRHGHSRVRFDQVHVFGAPAASGQHRLHNHGHPHQQPDQKARVPAVLDNARVPRSIAPWPCYEP